MFAVRSSAPTGLLVLKRFGPPQGLPFASLASNSSPRKTRRRHLSETQRSLVAAKIATLQAGRSTEKCFNKAITQETADDLLNVSRSGVQRAPQRSRTWAARAYRGR